VQLTLQSAIPDVRNDFNGDGRSDILWRHSAGTIGDWLANADNSGTYTSNGASIIAIDTYWSVAGTGDFNGDGRDDVLWRGASGELGNWLAAQNGSFAYNAAAGITAVPLSWQVAGIGDFNGDGKDDLLWRNSDGTIGTWSGQANGGFVANNATIQPVPNEWHIAATGDFNGDGKDDILWRHDNGVIADWLATAGGTFAPNNASLIGVSTDWHIVGAGDFNGDGRDDILWRHDNGAIADWLANENGTFTANGPSLVAVGNEWNIESIGDYNGDGKDDILWRHDNGTVGNWLGQANGTIVYNAAGGLTPIPNDWQVQDSSILYA
jgi:hypothetical protein